MKDNNSLAHSTWNCKYHLVFAPKYRYGNRHFGCKGYYVDTVGKNKKAIEEYIRKQLQKDIATDQISIKEYVDPFEKEQKEKERKIEKELGPLKW